MKEIINELHACKLMLKDNSAIDLIQFELNEKPAAATLINVQKELGRIETSVLDFYSISNGLTIKWKPEDSFLLQKDIIGEVAIAPFLQTVKDWSGVVFFDSDARDSPIREFFPLDFFSNEAAVGFCTKEGYRQMMYLYKFDGELIPLYIGFYSYLKLMMAANACIYWQYLLLELINGDENDVSKNIKQYLIDIFPGFSFNSFAETFQKLKIQ